jgi:signal recognition particle subunit SEC65
MSDIASAHGGKDAADWSEVRTTYETTRTTLREIADRFGISFSTTMKRAAREKWKKPGSVIVEARKKIDGAINKIVEETAQKMEAAVEEMAENTLAELNPGLSSRRRITFAGSCKQAGAESNASKSCGTATSRTILSLNHSRRRLWIDTTISFGAISA